MPLVGSNLIRLLIQVIGIGSNEGSALESNWKMLLYLANLVEHLNSKAHVDVE